NANIFMKRMAFERAWMRPSLEAIALGVVLAAGIYSHSAKADVGACLGKLAVSSSTGLIWLNPPNPDTSEPVRISVGAAALIPAAASADVHGNFIDVVLDGYYTGFLPPGITCGTVMLGPLPGGTYTVNFYNSDFTPPAVRLRLLATTSLVVGGTSPRV